MMQVSCRSVIRLARGVTLMEKLIDHLNLTLNYLSYQMSFIERQF